MGYKAEFNFVLKLKPEQGFPKKLELEKNYLFEKLEERIFPRGVPIDLIDNTWHPVAKVVVEDMVISQNKTRGNFRVIYIYDKHEKALLYNIYKKTIGEYIK